MEATADTTPAYRIAVDCMGGDRGPAEIVLGAKLALRDIGPEDTLILVGKEDKLRQLARKAGLGGNPRIQFRNATEIVTMEDKPMAFRSKKDASMVVALDMLKSGEADTMMSVGNTKVLVAASTLKLGRMSGAERPALAAIMPHCKGHFVLMDVGANPETTPGQLMHNAVMGTVYAQSVLRLHKPRLGLLTVGTEEGKGGERISRTHDLLKRLDGSLINYVGPVEGFDMFDGSLDVVVVDGFTGNILLKTVEGMFSMLVGMVRKCVGWNPLYWAGAAALLPLGVDIKRHLKPDKNGGAPLLGLKALVMKSHGSANRHAIRGTLRLGREALMHRMAAKLRDALASANALTGETVSPASAPTVPVGDSSAPSAPTA
ncbi:MAG: phosphate acyltransferase PlsX [Puniceicoccales bacterium]|jgi:glycerol-3-phosphate acyltransferase PlsX|nr:phosphate acyltransferase PlsX [Puniceicoccales bacterium]